MDKLKILLQKKFEEQKRFIMLETNKFIFINVYVPNGNLIGTEKYEYKLNGLIV